MAKIDGKKFTVTKIEDSDYDDKGTITRGVKITTKETFDVEGVECSKFHTTRVAVVKRFGQGALRDDVNGGNPLGPIKCVKEKTAAGKDFFNLVDA